MGLESIIITIIIIIIVIIIIIMYNHYCHLLALTLLNHSRTEEKVLSIS